MTHSYRFGIEEEYFVVDAATKRVARVMSAGFFAAARKELGPQVRGEFLQSQIEVATEPHVDVSAAQAELRHLRRTLADVAARHGLAVLACGTHPTATWTQQRQSEARRYDAVMHDLQMIGQRNQLCGLHVHVELPDPDDRVDVMRRIVPYLPLFVALSTSSPFWQSRRTGLMGYRLAAYDELPRTGLPDLFDSQADYEAYIRIMVEAGVIADSSYVWWAVRPSLKHPTLELRAPDCCTRLDDTVSLAALYRALVRMLVRRPEVNAALTPVSRALAVENKWRAQRYGIHGSFVDEASRRALPIADVLEQLLEDVAPDAEALGCLAEVWRTREILAHGTSADQQIAIFEEARGRSGQVDHALSAVQDWIAAATLKSGSGLSPARGRFPRGDATRPGRMLGPDDLMPAFRA
jgi:carboxylate-amine ligase